MTTDQARADLQIVYRSLAELTPYAKNPRTHSAEQIDQLATSMKEFGFTNPILIDEQSSIIAGHGRALAAAKANLESVPTITLAGLSDAQRKALVIADNKLALNAGWNNETLTLELISLRDIGFNLDITGFGAGELLTLFATKGETDPDDVPEAQPVAITRPGDVWIMGDHRLMCGDSTDEATVKKCLNGNKPHLMVTDPPYGVDYDPTWRDNAGGQFGDGKAKARGLVENDDKADWTSAWSLFDGDVIYCWHADLRANIVYDSLVRSGFSIRAQIIWRKPHFQLSRGHYHFQHEPCWYAVRKGRTGHWHGDRKQSTVWDIGGMNPAGRNRDEGNEASVHGTQKPVECMKRPMENNSAPGDGVYEPFSGSGTTIIAAEMTARKCFAIELNPIYVDVAVRRWQAFSGKIAYLEGTTDSFSMIEHSRSTKPAEQAAAV